MFLFSILPLTAILVPSASSEAYCSDGQLEKSVIDSILDPINKIRSVLAQGNLKDGKAPPANIFPQANAMNKLEWDCNLEKTAIRKLDCDISTAPVVNNKAVLFYDDPDEFGLSPSCAVAAWLREHSAASFNGLTGAPTEIKRPNNDGKFENFANLMNDKTTKIGCAHICESGKRPLLCLTNKPPIPKDGTGVIYTVNATKACSGCNKNTRPCNTETRLCEAPEQSTTESTTEATTKTTTETAKATTKATTKTTTETAKATTTTTMKASYPGELPTGTNKDCPDNVGMTDELRTQYVNTQNDKRSTEVLDFSEADEEAVSRKAAKSKDQAETFYHLEQIS